MPEVKKEIIEAMLRKATKTKMYMDKALGKNRAKTELGILIGILEGVLYEVGSSREDITGLSTHEKNKNHGNSGFAGGCT